MKLDRSIIILGGILIIQVLLLLPYVYTEVFNIDETIFAVSATEMLHGKLLYTDVWDIKPPGIFFIYYSLFQIFGAEIPHVHWLALIWRCLTTIGIFVLGSHLFSKETGYLAAFFYTVETSASYQKISLPT